MHAIKDEFEDTAARRFRQEPALRRREMLEKLAQKTDLDLGNVRTFLTNEGPLGFSGLRNQDADAFMYRFMTAWDQKDIQGVLDGFLPIRLTPMTATIRVPPLSRVKLGIGWSRGVARDAEQ